MFRTPGIPRKVLLNSRTIFAFYDILVRISSARMQS